MMNRELTAVGGLGEDRVAHDNLFTLRQRKWVEEYPNGFLYPPMNTARSSPAVVSISDGELLAVIGGYGDFWGPLSQVEVFQVTYARWYTLEDLPHPLELHSPSAAICGDQLHVIGGSTLGYSCSLQALIESRIGTAPHIMDISPTSTSDKRDTCEFLWTAGHYWRDRPKFVTSQLHLPARE